MKTKAEVRIKLSHLKKQERNVFKILKKPKKKEGILLTDILGYQLKWCELIHKIKALEWVLEKHKFC